MKKGREKGGERRKKKRVIKHTLKYLYEAKMTTKNPQKRGRILEGRGKNLYTPELGLFKNS